MWMQEAETNLVADASRITTTAKKQVPDDEPDINICPLAIQNAKGAFTIPSSAEDSEKFSNVVLLTASNWAYSDFLQNWEFMAQQQGLKWAVLALDEQIYQHWGADRAVPSDPSFRVQSEQRFGFRSEGFNTLSCNKMRLVLQVMEDCDTDVVFSDSDNVFFQNPFQHDLGSLIRSQRYHYIYQPNSRPKPWQGITAALNRASFQRKEIRGSTTCRERVP